VAAPSLIEVVFVLGVAATLASGAVLLGRTTIASMRSLAAGRFVVALLHDARTRAIERGADTALRVRRDPSGFLLAVYEDGNRNGVLSTDVASGVDPQIGPSLRLPDRFHGVDFGVLPGIPGPDGSAPPGTDPVRLGVADSATFSPTGSASSGSLYLKGSDGSQYVVRLYGETGRLRLLKFHPGTRRWLPL
jgi:hypothetical protein